MPPRPYRSLQEVADATNKLALEPSPLLGDLYADKIIPVRPLVTLTALECAERILFPSKEPTLAWSEFFPSLAAEGMAADFEARNLWLVSDVPESNGWKASSHVHGAASWPWGVTFLATEYHDYSAQEDVDFLLRLGSLQLALAWHRRVSMGRLLLQPSAWHVQRVLALAGRAGFDAEPDDVRTRLEWSWPKEAPLGGVVARLVDSRQYATRTKVLGLTEPLAKEILAYYHGKARVIAKAVDAEATNIAREWDRRNPRDTVSGYEFYELDAPTADAESVLMMKWHAKKRLAASKRDLAIANAEAGQAFYRGILKPKKYRLPDAGAIATVAKPPKGKGRPFVRFVEHRDDESLNAL